MRRLIAFLLVSSIASCMACSLSDIVSTVRLPDGAVRFDPTGGVVTSEQRAAGMAGVSWRWHFQVMERCTGRSKSYDALTWYYYPNTRTFDVAGQGQKAGWWDGSHGIYLSDEARFRASSIRHEMWHYLTGRWSHDGIEECAYELMQPGARSHFPEIPSYTDATRQP